MGHTSFAYEVQQSQLFDFRSNLQGAVPGVLNARSLAIAVPSGGPPGVHPEPDSLNRGTHVHNGHVNNKQPITNACELGHVLAMKPSVTTRTNVKSYPNRSPTNGVQSECTTLLPDA